jgi:hypothetical protein
MINQELLAGRHPAVQQIARFFEYGHLPSGSLMWKVSFERCEHAEYMIEQLPDGPELTAGLRKLLEAKDCFVRAALPPPADSAAARPAGAGSAP